MHIFEDDDAGYLAWIDGHQHGFVVYTTRKPDPGYLILHRASCGTIRGKPARGERWTTGEFIKVCAETRAELDQWARQNVGGELHPCGLCRPDSARSLRNWSARSNAKPGKWRGSQRSYVPDFDPLCQQPYTYR